MGLPSARDLCNVEWFKECQMLFNADKCKRMHVGYDNKQAEYDMNDVNWNVSQTKKTWESL